MTKRASYRHGVRWIAFGDNEGEASSIAELRCYMTVHFLADLFGKENWEVARDVWNYRKKHGYPVKK